MSVDDVSLRLFFCVFNLVWTTLFLEAWKRESASLAYKWGTLGQDKFEECRAAYYGELRKWGVQRVAPRTTESCVSEAYTGSGRVLRRAA